MSEGGESGGIGRCLAPSRAQFQFGKTVCPSKHTLLPGPVSRASLAQGEQVIFLKIEFACRLRGVQTRASRPARPGPDRSPPALLFSQLSAHWVGREAWGSPSEAHRPAFWGVRRGERGFLSLEKRPKVWKTPETRLHGTLVPALDPGLLRVL